MKRLFIIMISVLAMMTASFSAKAQDVTIDLVPGWNYIAYPYPTTVELNTFLSSITPMNGDIIKSFYGSSLYLNGRWRGAITILYPGEGYHYYSNNPEIITLVLDNPIVPEETITITTGEPTDITAESATVGGEVTLLTDTHVFMRGVCWGTTSDPDIDGSYFLDGAGEGPFNVTLDELTPNTTYYVRTYAVSDHGLAYGEEKSFTTLDNGGGEHAYVDLGLPSGLLWATCNVGAENPEDYGNYFAWGETTTKSTYNWGTYQYCNGISNTLTKYCNNSSYGYNGFTDNLTILLPEDDAATANWGNGWRMPTKEEFEELYNNTTVTWTTQNGVNGRLFTASNGNTLFLPAAGCRYISSLDGAGNFGYYWSSSLYTGSPHFAWSFYFGSDNYGVYLYYRYYGHSVRPVRSGQNNAPTGAINGKFTINDDGGQVYFSRGNLQYQASTNTWKFAENQWDMIGSENSNISENYVGWIDLFGWGTSGYHDANDPYNVNYQPWSTSTSEVNSNYNYYGYGPSTDMTDPNLTGTSANYDWGVYNPISNGGNQAGQWRSLTQSEWNYVFNTRTTASGIRYAKSNVNNVNGVILLPDDWSSVTYSLSNTNKYNASFSSNTISASQWTTLESAGAVFLPAAGDRSGTSVGNVGFSGRYWSASYYGSDGAYLVHFDDSNLYADDYDRRYGGQSVRLVRVAEN